MKRGEILRFAQNDMVYASGVSTCHSEDAEGGRRISPYPMAALRLRLLRRELRHHPPREEAPRSCHQRRVFQPREAKVDVVSVGDVEPHPDLLHDLLRRPAEDAVADDLLDRDVLGPAALLRPGAKVGRAVAMAPRIAGGC